MSSSRTSISSQMDASSKKKKIVAFDLTPKVSQLEPATSGPSSSGLSTIPEDAPENEPSNLPVVAKRTRPRLPPSPPYPIEPIPDEIREGRDCFFYASYIPYRRIADIARRCYPGRDKLTLDLDLATDSDMLFVQAMLQTLLGGQCRIRRTVVDQWHKDNIKKIKGEVGSEVCVAVVRIDNGAGLVWATDPSPTLTVAGVEYLEKLSLSKPCWWEGYIF
ncbi:hypothetical protein BXZ70DRAFT_929453, partial [Cristinia sonorae]